MRKILMGVALVGVLGVIALLIWGMVLQAQAARQTALAMKLSTAGHTASSLGLLIWVGLAGLLLIAGGGACGYLWLRWQRAERRTARAQRPAGTWTPGPHTYWECAPELPVSNLEPLLEKLVQVELLRALHELRSAHPSFSQPEPWPRLDMAEEPLNEDSYWGWD